jgi:hypothetical protein
MLLVSRVRDEHQLALHVSTLQLLMCRDDIFQRQATRDHRPNLPRGKQVKEVGEVFAEPVAVLRVVLGQQT